MCIRDSLRAAVSEGCAVRAVTPRRETLEDLFVRKAIGATAVSYTHLRAHETVLDLVCRLLLEKKKTAPPYSLPW